MDVCSCRIDPTPPNIAPPGGRYVTCTATATTIVRDDLPGHDLGAMCHTHAALWADHVPTVTLRPIGTPAPDLEPLGALLALGGGHVPCTVCGSLSPAWKTQHITGGTHGADLCVSCADALVVALNAAPIPFTPTRLATT